jgi:hypothetical protein
MTDAEVAAAIRARLAARAPRTACPTEVARELAADWRPLMPVVRAVAATMPDVVATRRGAPVDPEAPGGPIRLALRDAPPKG